MLPFTFYIFHWKLFIVHIVIVIVLSTITYIDMRLAYFIYFCLILLTGCRDGTAFQPIKNGLEFKAVVRNKDGMMVQNGQYLKLSVTQVLGDTVLRDPAKWGYEYQYMDSGQMSADAWTIFKDARTGDSLVFRVSRDSAFKKPIPEFAKRRKEDWLETRVKVLAVLENEDSVRADRERYLGVR